MSEVINKHRSVTAIVYSFLLTVSVALLGIIVANMMFPQTNYACSGPGFADGCEAGIWSIIGSTIGILFILGLVVAATISVKQLLNLLRVKSKQ